MLYLNFLFELAFSDSLPTRAGGHCCLITVRWKYKSRVPTGTPLTLRWGYFHFFWLLVRVLLLSEPPLTQPKHRQGRVSLPAGDWKLGLSTWSSLTPQWEPLVTTQQRYKFWLPSLTAPTGVLGSLVMASWRLESGSPSQPLLVWRGQAQVFLWFGCSRDLCWAAPFPVPLATESRLLSELFCLACWHFQFASCISSKLGNSRNLFHVISQIPRWSAFSLHFSASSYVCLIHDVQDFWLYPVRKIGKICLFSQK